MTLTDNFIEQQLPPPPARVLDAGCGDGALARIMLARGYDVTAIDIDPQRADDVVRCADICTFGITDPTDAGPYDVVIFSLSLHHVSDLAAALDRAQALLRPGGRLIVDEFAHERAGDRIADLFFAEPNSLPRWREHHGDYHTGEAVSSAIAARFDVTLAHTAPYLYRYLNDESLRDTETVLGLQLVATRSDYPTKENIMPIIRTTRYTIAPENIDEALARRNSLIAVLRDRVAGPTSAQLCRLQDGTYVDIWRWNSHEDLQAAQAAAPSLPETAAAFALVPDAIAENAEIVDER
jgi:SAM-dependent methyltransferase